MVIWAGKSSYSPPIGIHLPLCFSPALEIIVGKEPSDTIFGLPKPVNVFFNPGLRSELRDQHTKESALKNRYQETLKHLLLCTLNDKIKQQEIDKNT